MRKAFPQKVLQDLGLDASAPSPNARGRRRRTTMTAATSAARVRATRELEHLVRTLQPELDELDRGW